MPQAGERDRSAYSYLFPCPVSPMVLAKSPSASAESRAAFRREIRKTRSAQMRLMMFRRDGIALECVRRNVKALRPWLRMPIKSSQHFARSRVKSRHLQRIHELCSKPPRDRAGWQRGRPRKDVPAASRQYGSPRTENRRHTSLG